MPWLLKILAVAALVGVAIWSGSKLVDIDRRNDLAAVARSTENRLGEVTRVLRQATANVQGTDEDPAKTAWGQQVNGVCSRQSDALRKLGTPATVDEIAVYLDRALPIVRRHHARLGSLPPPEALAGRASRAGRALLKQEGLLAQVRAASRRGDTTGTLQRIEQLRSLARTANPNLIRLGLAECALSSPGIPL
jgi:hypothetical protein